MATRGHKRQKDYRVKNGKIYARITYMDEQGKRKDVMRLADSRAHAKELATQMRQELKDHGQRIIDADKLKFEKLASYYEADKVKPAKYQEGRKIEGLRSVDSVRLHLKALIAHFGQLFIKTITPGDIEKFKAERLDTTAQRSGEKLTIATVNRELELLRAIFNFAKREGWLAHSPFEKLKGIISKADERQRDRVLTDEEEKRLLEACDGPRAHLRGILLCGIDTAMRRGEILKLRWRDVDLESKTIKILAMNSKTAKERIVGMTVRLWIELTRLWEESPKDLDMLVFGIKTNFKRAFKKACEVANIENFRFHDTRHTATTRIVKTNAFHTQEAMKVTGHTQQSTFARYINVGEQTARRVAEALDALQTGVVTVENVECGNENGAPASDLIN